MDLSERDRFVTLWNAYFPESELPITFEIGGSTDRAEKAPAPKGWKCLVCDLLKVRKGRSVVFDQSSVSCTGGKIYTGYETQRSPEFRYFLSSGKEGVVNGERYKQTPEMVDETVRRMEYVQSQGKTFTFRRWDQLGEADHPEVVIFFARPEVISGLFTLANFDQVDPEGVICPFGAGCSSIIHHPWLEQQKENPRAVLGMFDPSARPCVGIDVLTMAFPMKKFSRVIGYMDKSFLITETWGRVKKKIAMSNSLLPPGKIPHREIVS
jgi:uncharacterized protein (DUF169 family)